MPLAWCGAGLALVTQASGHVSACDDELETGAGSSGRAFTEFAKPSAEPVAIVRNAGQPAVSRRHCDRTPDSLRPDRHARAPRQLFLPVVLPQKRMLPGASIGIAPRSIGHAGGLAAERRAGRHRRREELAKDEEVGSPLYRTRSVEAASAARRLAAEGPIQRTAKRPPSRPCPRARSPVRWIEASVQALGIKSERCLQQAESSRAPPER